MTELQNITIEALIERYAVLLLDAYGVLVNDSGALAGAADLIRMLNRTQKPYYLVTNDASKLPQTTAARFQSYGLEIAPNRIITSGTLLKNHFKIHNLQGARCVVLGPDDSAQYVVDAGGKVVPPAEDFDGRHRRRGRVSFCRNRGHGFKCSFSQSGAWGRISADPAQS